ncbi:hypothetical protein BASA50_002126 [Batrachochytrium salamandrivorans]|uniref:Snurportin-1 n=1 Tax=Batrachochytrium salamandrivorans TaxID=1357716 RepID=A0ABQ8FMH5_9FUNG|nr:hypothetical protein BASA60_008148 [Batrachochytrium salamandrivorans]KAH6575081.1 hypothetical protein BASA62_002118 [Batrachochytrium salamandrivorans]KAH6584817.1 hypothetical protein BASA61_007185 [Batrachochytrium salamandrivorans]KAH6600562.1 hypothetical protein BASA50_002126 [Batrachochytrium salamandrivorans]KAH9255954.1 hypothetical protein BASA81_005990 [Batrachochytrium salamandrivorans]
MAQTNSSEPDGLSQLQHVSSDIPRYTPDNSPDNSPATSSYTPQPTAHRKAQYKPQPAMGQDVRRQKALEIQKLQRLQRVNAARHLTETVLEINDASHAESDSTADIHLEHGQPAQLSNISSENDTAKEAVLAPGSAGSNAMSGVRSLYSKSLVMQPEPLIEIPSDLVTGWISMVFPQGERCLLVSANGKTTSRGIKGHRIDTFLSCLPGGSYASVSPRQNKPCIFDCIYHAPTQTYYALDILMWNGAPVHECDTDFRQYWLHSRLSEVDVGRIIMANQRRIVPIQAYGCTVDELRMQLAQAESNALAAGMFLLNRQCFYSAGESTPLFCTIVFPDRLLESTAVSQSLGVLQTWLISNP